MHPVHARQKDWNGAGQFWNRPHSRRGWRNRHRGGGETRIAAVVGFSRIAFEKVSHQGKTVFCVFFQRDQFRPQWGERQKNAGQHKKETK
jgi:hypothetical protein